MIANSHEKLSILVPCFNNEAYIEDCLRLLTWADELVVCDSYSTDNTVEVARRFADRVLVHEYENSATQKNWAIPQLAHPWVLVVDTDERVPPELRQEIQGVLESPESVAGFDIPRANFVFGRWLRHGGEWPDRQIRLFRRDAGRYEDREVHADVLLSSPSKSLSTPLIHYPHATLESLSRTLLGRYVKWEARQKQKAGVVFSWKSLAIRPVGAFFVRYCVRGGYRDGWQGLLMAFVWAVYVFKTYWTLRAISDRRAIAE